MPAIEVPGLPAVNVVRSGPRGRPPILFLHPAGLDLTWWHEQFAALTGDHDVLAFDLPGHGLSGPLATPPRFDVLARVVEAVLDHAGAASAHLVGVSVGGMIAQTFALRAPERVESLTLVATLCTFPGPVREALRERARVARTEGMARIAELSNERWFPPAFRERRPDLLDRATGTLLRQDPAFHAGMWEMIAGLDLTADLPAIASPTLVVAGEEDGPIPQAGQVGSGGLQLTATPGFQPAGRTDGRWSRQHATATG